MQPTSNHYYYSYEWCYKNIEPKIICEEYIEQMDGNLLDYKLFTFNGIIKYIDLHIFRFTENHSRCFYDTNWNRYNATIKFNLFQGEVEKPKVLDHLLYLGEKLSKYFPHVRLDFYIIKNDIFFGEMTFYNGSGYDYFKPKEWDYKFGELLELPKDKKLEYDLLEKEAIIEEACNLEPIVKQYRDLEYNFHCTNINNSNIINTLNSDINIKNNTIDYLSNEIEDLKLNINWFSILSIFGIQLFAISNNANYLRLTILGIKLTFKVNEKSINKMAWWIPIKGLRNNFRSKFKIEDQTRPDQTRPDQTRPDQTRPNIYTIHFYIYNNTKNQKLQPMLQYTNAA